MTIVGGGGLAAMAGAVLIATVFAAVYRPARALRRARFVFRSLGVLSAGTAFSELRRAGVATAECFREWYAHHGHALPFAARRT
jgi:hypothetical protein